VIALLLKLYCNHFTRLLRGLLRCSACHSTFGNHEGANRLDIMENIASSGCFSSACKRARVRLRAVINAIQRECAPIRNNIRAKIFLRVESPQKNHGWGGGGYPPMAQPPTLIYPQPQRDSNYVTYSTSQKNIFAKIMSLDLIIFSCYSS